MHNTTGGHPFCETVNLIVILGATRCNVNCLFYFIAFCSSVFFTLLQCYSVWTREEGFVYSIQIHIGVYSSVTFVVCLN